MSDWDRKFRIDDKVAIITGGAGILGREYGYTLASAGAHVVLADIDGQGAREIAEGIRNAHKVECLPIETDVSRADSVQEMVDQTFSEFGKIDILINNAALDPKFDPKSAQDHINRFEDFPFESWQQAVDVNITGMFLCSQAVSKPMLAAKRGVIVNVSSTYGMVGPDQRLYQREGENPRFKPVTYTVAKAAAHGLTKYLATYFAGQGIRVNTLSPGGVFSGHDEEFVKRYSAKTVLGRMAEKDEMSSAMLFLVSDASSYMTGANLVVDGGWTTW